jgi:hypothetical protein
MEAPATVDARIDRIAWNTFWFPNLHRMALDILSIPAMCAEVERLFSQCKRIITDDRHSLEPDRIEALECLKSFFRRWIHQGQRGGRAGQ